MPARLPRWVWLGAASLALVAGMVNVVGYLGFEHLALSHLTGTASLLGSAASGGRWDAAFQLGTIIAAFVGGAVLSGLVIQDSALRLGRRYGVALAIEAVLLAAAVPLFEQGSHLGPALAAAACGLQNAMTATYSGALVRTTHLTGMFTDLGVFLGHRLRGLPVEPKRLWLSLLIIAGFTAGGLLGAWLFEDLAYRTLLVPAALTGVTGIAYAAYRHWHRL